jgi:PAS domain S-box-containing protein
MTAPLTTERRALRLLMVEDSRRDAEMLLLTLTEAGFDVHHTRVQTAADLRAALANDAWDLVITDFQMPQFDAFGTVAVLRETDVDLPCFVVSGTIGEEVAVQCMRAGSRDYFLKTHLARLPAAIRRELGEAAERAERRRMERALEALQDLAFTTGGPAQPAEIARVAVDRARDLLRVDIAALYWWEPEGDRLVLVAQTGDPRQVRVESLAPGVGVSGLAFAKRAPVIVADYSRPPPDVTVPNGLLMEGSAIAVPIAVGDRVLGALYLRSNALRVFEPHETRSLSLLAAQVGPALDSGRLFRHLRESQERFSVTFQASPTPMYVTRVSDRVTTDVNDSFCEFTGYARDELVGRDLVRDIPALGRLPARTAAATTAAAGVVTDEVLVRTKGGQTRPVLALVRLAEIGGEPHFITVWVDLAERRRISELEREQDIMRAANTAKSAFLANMSHELRTPLNAILGFSDLLLEDLDLRGSHLRYLKNIKDAGEHLLELINDVLDLSKVEAGKVTLRTEIVSLAALLEPVVTAMQANAKAQGLSFSAVAPDAQALTLDPTRVRQVLFNLVSNAIKYTPAGGAVELRVATDGADLHIAVSDTGIGIPLDRQSRVFGLFERLHEDRSSVPGTGLGLALTKRLVELHGGTIDFDSEPGRGSTFRVRLPGVHHVAVQGERILIVEDEPRDADLIATLAAMSEVPAEVVRSLAEARAAIAANAPIGAIVDLRLPDGRGEELIGLLREHPSGRRTPVVVISVEAEPAQLSTLGVDDYLTKPLDRARLERWLRTVPRPQAGQARGDRYG